MPIPAELQSLLSELKISPPTKEHDAVETVEALLAAVTDMDCSFSKNLLIKDKKAGRHGQGPLWQGPSSPPTPPRGAPGGSGQFGAPREEAGPLGAPPPPRLLELAASKVADFDRLWTTQDTPRRRAVSLGYRSRPSWSPSPRTPCATPASRRSGPGVQVRGHSSTEAR